MRAVRRFKNAIASKRPHLRDGILGRESRMVQPPMSISGPNPPPLQHKPKSVDTHDRKLIEKALVVEGVHREIDSQGFDISLANKENPMAVPHSPNKSRDAGQIMTRGLEPPKRELDAHPEDHRSESYAQPQNTERSKEHGKGQAHDPLDDHPFLYIGPGGSDEIPDPPAVSESPPAAGCNIYEAAYKEEIRRIREKRGKGATLYLTRRVDKKEYLDDENIVAGSRDSGSPAPKSSFAKLLDRARGKGDRGKEEKDKEPTEDGTLGQDEERKQSDSRCHENDV
jgi:[calcium/calmodulin-dependent protein kinase] kinase